MKIQGASFRTIWATPDDRAVEVIDQRVLPHKFETIRIVDVEDAIYAITSMAVRGAPLIGAMAAYGLALALRDDPDAINPDRAYGRLLKSRPTAVNLRFALDEISACVAPLARDKRAEAAWRRAGEFCEEDVAACRGIGEAGAPLIESVHRRTGRTVNILTHCNAGWLATVDWGTATAPIYLAHDRKIPVHVFVDETRPRNQGAALTTFELGEHGVPHTLIADNAGGHLMQRGEIDLCIVGADRVTAHGDAANKIGTYLKALAAAATSTPFYIAIPQSTIDWTIADGVKEIEIEERDPSEVTHVVGRLDDGSIGRVAVGPVGVRARNPAFDVTPAGLISALITDRGVCAANPIALAKLFGRFY